MRLLPLLTVFILACAVVAVAAEPAALKPEWSADEFKRIQSLSIASLVELPSDPSNRVADNPAAAAFGKVLFGDSKFSGNGRVSCASCHNSERQFQDDLPVGHGMGTGTRRTMPIAGTAYAPFLFWDGRKDSQWSQALGPLESSLEHGADRTMVVQLVAAQYRVPYEALFGPLPNLKNLPAHAAPTGAPETVAAWEKLNASQQNDINLVFANTGKAIAAFERSLSPEPTKFDAYAAALAREDNDAASEILTPGERDGLKLFIGKANCLDCHNGPLLTDQGFHNIGLPLETPDSELGRIAAVAALSSDQFNCLGKFSDAGINDCSELKFMETKSKDLIGAFKSPSLRGVAQRPPYTHTGQMKTLREVIEHYNEAPDAQHGHSELRPLKLNQGQLKDLEAFLTALNVPQVGTEENAE